MSLESNTAALEAILEMASSLPDKVDTSGTATAADIYTGKTATVDDVKLTGTNPYNAANVDPQVTSILSALTDKGVDTTGAGLDDIAGLIAAIESGGGGEINGYKLVSGTFTVAEIPTSDLVISHEAISEWTGMYPEHVVLIFCETSETAGSTMDNLFSATHMQKNRKWHKTAYLYTSGTSLRTGTSKWLDSPTASGFTISQTYVAGKFNPGLIYTWVRLIKRGDT